MDRDTRLALTSVLFALLAAYSLWSGLSADTAVPTDQGEIANLQLMQIQSANIAIGIGSAVISAIFAVGAAIVGALCRPD